MLLGISTFTFKSLNFPRCLKTYKKMLLGVDKKFECSIGRET
jgi:hypothetical protein